MIKGCSPHLQSRLLSTGIMFCSPDDQWPVPNDLLLAYHQFLCRAQPWCSHHCLIPSAHSISPSIIWSEFSFHVWAPNMCSDKIQSFMFQLPLMPAQVTSDCTDHQLPGNSTGEPFCDHYLIRKPIYSPSPHRTSGAPHPWVFVPSLQLIITRVMLLTSPRLQTNSGWNKTSSQTVKLSLSMTRPLKGQC